MCAHTELTACVSLSQTWLTGRGIFASQSAAGEYLDLMQDQSVSCFTLRTTKWYVDFLLYTCSGNMVFLKNYQVLRSLTSIIGSGGKVTEDNNYADSE